MLGCYRWWLFCVGPFLDRWGWINKKHRGGSVLFVVVVFKRLFVGFFGGGVGAVAHGGGVVI